MTRVLKQRTESGMLTKSSIVDLVLQHLNAVETYLHFLPRQPYNSPSVSPQPVLLLVKGRGEFKQYLLDSSVKLLFWVDSLKL